MSTSNNSLTIPDSYLNLLHTGLAIKINHYYVDLSHGETSRSDILMCEKNNLDESTAFSILCFRKVFTDNGWTNTEFSEQTLEDVRNNSRLSEYEPSQIAVVDELIKDNDYFMFSHTFDKNEIKEVWFNDKIIDTNDFLSNCPLPYTKFLKVYKKIQSGIRCQFYFVTNHNYILFNWFTTG